MQNEIISPQLKYINVSDILSCELACCVDCSKLMLKDGLSSSKEQSTADDDDDNEDGDMQSSSHYDDEFNLPLTGIFTIVL